MCPRAVFRFVQVGDLALLSEADVAVREIEKWEKEAEARGGGKARIDLLFMTASPVLFQPRTGMSLLILCYVMLCGFLHLFSSSPSLPRPPHLECDLCTLYKRFSTSILYLRQLTIPRSSSILTLTTSNNPRNPRRSRHLHLSPPLLAPPLHPLRPPTPPLLNPTLRPHHLNLRRNSPRLARHDRPHSPQARKLHLHTLARSRRIHENAHVRAAGETVFWQT